MLTGLWQGAGTSDPEPRFPAMQVEQTKLVGIVEMPMDDERKALALLFDNMRWVFFYSSEAEDYAPLDLKIGTTVTMTFDTDSPDGATLTGWKH